MTIINFNKPVRTLLATFLLVAGVGYASALIFIERTTHFNPQGIEENYLGNENDETAEEMLFKKSEREIITTIHNHVLGLSVLFLAVGFIYVNTPMGKKHYVWAVEPFISLILTFGGIYLLWKGVLWFKYIIFLSGIAMTFSFYTMIIVSLWSIFKQNR